MAEKRLSQTDSVGTNLHEMRLLVPFPSTRLAEIAFNTLKVDREPRRGGCKKELGVDGCNLSVIFRAKEAKTLRVASNSFLDFLILVTETIEQFDVDCKCVFE
eukprot:gene11786-13006_t